jgi:hypothetical protein
MVRCADIALALCAQLNRRIINFRNFLQSFGNLSLLAELWKTSFEAIDAAVYHYEARSR